MSMLIIGVNPPKSCYACSWYNKVECPVNDGRYYYRAQRHPSCPLIELPPHGDLVDLSDTVHPNDSMRRMTIDEQLRRTCEEWSADRKQYVVIEAEGSET